MKLLILLTVLVLSGCANMTPAEKQQTALIIGGIIVVGAIAANSGGSSSAAQNCYWVVGPGNDSTRVCQ